MGTLSGEAQTSRRSFTRHFKAVTGASSAAWLLKERLLYSQRLLKSSGESIETVADLAGFGSAAAMRMHFRVALGVTPAVLRERFDAPKLRRGHAMLPPKHKSPPGLHPQATQADFRVSGQNGC